MSQSIKYRSANRGAFGSFDKLLLLAVGGLLVMGTLLVYAGTREWFRSYGLDPEYYLKRHSLNIIIGGLLAYGTTLIDYRLLRAYTPIVWLAAVIGLIIVLIPGLGTEINGAKAWPCPNRWIDNFMAWLLHHIRAPIGPSSQNFICSS